MRLSAALLALVSLARVFAPPFAATLPPKFQDTYLAKILAPINLAFLLTTDRLLMKQKSGQLWLLHSAEAGSTKHKILDLSLVLCTKNERGLGSVAVHLDFDRGPGIDRSRFMYLYYTFNKHGTCKNRLTVGPVNRLSRFVLSKSTDKRTWELCSGSS